VDPDPDSDPTFYVNAYPDPGFDAHNLKIIQINTAQGSVVDPERELEVVMWEGSCKICCGSGTLFATEMS
jgi:hypothetical protein